MRYKPIYGYGWRYAQSGGLLDVPEEFDVLPDADDSDEGFGTICEPHSFAGKRVRLTLRTEANGKQSYNVEVFSENGEIDITGFAHGAS